MRVPPSLIVVVEFGLTIADMLQNGDATAEEVKAVSDSNRVIRGAVLPIRKPVPVVESVAVTADMKANKAYATLRLERMNARLVGIRAKKKAEAEKEEKAAAEKA